MTMHDIEARRDMAIKLAHGGLSRSEIAEKIGVTKGSICGILHRAKIKGLYEVQPRAKRKRAEKPLQKRHTPPRPTIKRMTGPDLPVLAKPRKTDLARHAIPDQQPVEFRALKANQCVFILECISVASGPSSPCCGAERADGKPYCQIHCGIVYAKDTR